MKKPVHPKVKAGGLGGALATVILWALVIAGIEVPAEVAAAITTVVGFAAGWLQDA